MMECVNPIESVSEEFWRQTKETGLLRMQSANDVIFEASKLPDPVNLYDDIIFENTMCCLFADTGLGKSILAVQIGEEIAQSQPVIYLDCELSDKQFELRYRSDHGTEHHRFPDKFFRVSIVIGAIFSKGFEDAVLTEIRRLSEKIKAKVIIIDNLTYLCNGSEKPEIATIFMKKLKELKDEGYTLIVIAHTPKLSQYRPITDCDMAGSRRLANFFDTIIALGRSAKDTNIRYLKQVKGNRTSVYKYDADNVLICQIQKEDNALRLMPIKTDMERNHLKSLSEEDEAEITKKVLNLSKLGFSYRKISQELGISKSSIGRIIKKNCDNE